MSGKIVVHFLLCGVFLIGNTYAKVNNIAEKAVLTPESIKSKKAFNHISPLPVTILKGHRSFVHDIAFNNDELMASAGGDSTVILWNYRTGEQVRTIKGLNGYVYAVAFSPDGSLLATGGWDGEVRLWNVHNGTLHSIVGKHSTHVYDVNFSPDGKKIVSASWDNTAKVWDKETGELIITLTGHKRYVSSAVFSPDGSLIATASGDGTVKLWDPNSGLVLRTLTSNEQTHWYCNHVSFSPDGQSIAASTSGGENPVYVWNIQGERLQTLKGHKGFVPSTEFSRGGTRIASVGEDNSLRLWNTNNGEQLHAAQEPRYFLSNAYNATGDIVAAAALDGTITLWQVETENLPQAKSGKSIEQKSELYTIKAVPNPASSRVTVQFTIPESGYCTVELLSQDGKLVSTLYENTASAGVNSIDHDVQLLTSGVYYITLTAQNKTVSCRVDVVR